MSAARSLSALNALERTIAREKRNLRRWNQIVREEGSDRPRGKNPYAPRISLLELGDFHEPLQQRYRVQLSLHKLAWLQRQARRRYRTRITPNPA